MFASWKGAAIGYPTLYYSYPLLSVTENCFIGKSSAAIPFWAEFSVLELDEEGVLLVF